MRDQGRLVEWFDDQGYGFIQPSDPAKDRVFLHIKDFAKPGPRPIVGCALDYLVILDERGRYRAQQVMYLESSTSQKSASQTQTLQATADTEITADADCLCALYSFFGGFDLGRFTQWDGVVTGQPDERARLLAYAQDKEAAQLGNRRIPENTLHVMAFLGGWPAAWLAQQKLRHKTQKQPFRQDIF